MSEKLPDCPKCGLSVLLVFWEWPSEAPVSAEYHHHRDAERDRAGLPPEPCQMTYDYETARQLRFGGVNP